MNGRINHGRARRGLHIACGPGEQLIERLERRQLLGADPFNLAGSRVVLSTPDAYHATAMADLDQDGDVDIVASAGPRVYTLLNNGQGGFVPTQTFRVAGFADQIALGDYDGDGDLDLAVQGPGDGSSELMRMYTFDGDGTWTRSVTFKLTADQIMVGNFDGDARAEILVVTADGAKVYNTNAGIAHSPRTIFTTPEADHADIVDAAVGDLNADGIDDAVFAVQAMAPLPNSEDQVDIAKIYESRITANSAQTFDRLTRLNARIDSIAIGQVTTTNSTRPDIVFTGSELFFDSGVTFAVGVLVQNNDGSYANARKLYSESYDSNVPTVKIDLLQVRQVDMDLTGGNDIVTRIERTQSDNFTRSSELRVLRNQGASAWTSSVSDATSSPDQHPAYMIQDVSTADNRPDLLYWVLTPGGKNKLRFAANQMTLV